MRCPLIDSLITHLSDLPQSYDGTQLSPQWIYRRFDLMGHALVAFVGPANVTIEHMVDLEDVKHHAPIYSPRMLHFLGEFFIDSFYEGILAQNLLVSDVYQTLLERGLKNMRRRGNDLYYNERKLSVCVATKSQVSVLVHMGLNIETKDTPIPTSGLDEMGIEPFEFARHLLRRYREDVDAWRKARFKVCSR